MYIALIVILISFSAALVLQGLRTKKTIMTGAGIVSILSIFLFFGFMEFWADVLWFDSLGYVNRFWRVFVYKALLGILGGGLGVLVLWSMTLFLFDPSQRHVRWIPVAVGLYFGIQWANTNWDTILLYFNSLESGISDPILNKDVGFYLFRLPFYEEIYMILLVFCIIGLFSAFAGIFLKISKRGIDFREPWQIEQDGTKRINWIYLNFSVFLLVLSWGQYLNRFNLLYSRFGVVFGAGWTDVNIKLPAFGIVAVLLAFAAVILGVPAIRKFIRIPSIVQLNQPYLNTFGPLLITTVVSAGLWAVSIKVVPGLMQWLRVSPNEISFEKPYIENNIQFTRNAYRLDAVEEKEFPVSETLNPQTIENNMNLIKNVRLWDWRALDQVYAQFQEIRLYYEFSDVDADRYHFADSYRQVMVSARELQLDNLPVQSQTFVNDRLSYSQTFDKALEGLFKETKPTETLPAMTDGQSVDALINSADEAFNNYLNYLGQKEFRRASDELTRLQKLLSKLKQSVLQQDPSQSQTDNQRIGRD